MLGNTPNQPTKFRTKTYNRERITLVVKLNFKLWLRLRSSLCDYSDACILVKGIISIAAQAGDNPNSGDKELVFVPFTDCVSEINNTQTDNAKDIDVIMPVHNLIEYSYNYLKALESLWQYYRHEPALTDDGTIANFCEANNSVSFRNEWCHKNKRCWRNN